jgi:hypothetical protein
MPSIAPPLLYRPRYAAHATWRGLQRDAPEAHSGSDRARPAFQGVSIRSQQIGLAAATYDFFPRRRVLRQRGASTKREIEKCSGTVGHLRGQSIVEKPNCFVEVAAVSEFETIARRDDIGKELETLTPMHVVVE